MKRYAPLPGADVPAPDPLVEKLLAQRLAVQLMHDYLSRQDQKFCSVGLTEQVLKDLFGTDLRVENFLLRVEDEALELAYAQLMHKGKCA